MNVRQLGVYTVVAAISGGAGAWLTSTLAEPAGAAAPAVAAAAAKAVANSTATVRR